MKTDKDYKKFIKSLMKYNDKNNNYFTSKQIPQIFDGWTDLEFNKIHHGIGKGCCTYMGPNPGYQINVAHCNSIAHKFNESRKTTIRIWLAVIAVILGLIALYFRLQ